MGKELDPRSLDPMKYDFPYKGKTYTLWEPSEEVSIQITDFQVRNPRTGPDGKTVVDIHRPHEARSLLLSLCVVDSEGKPVDLTTIRSWPRRTVEFLHTKAEEMQQLSKEETEESIEDQIKALQMKLEVVRRDAGGSYLKNSSRGTSVLSASAP